MRKRSQSIEQLENKLVESEQGSVFISAPQFVQKNHIALRQTKNMRRRIDTYINQLKKRVHILEKHKISERKTGLKMKMQLEKIYQVENFASFLFLQQNIVFILQQARQKEMQKLQQKKLNNYQFRATKRQNLNYSQNEIREKMRQKSQDNKIQSKVSVFNQYMKIIRGRQQKQTLLQAKQKFQKIKKGQDLSKQRRKRYQQHLNIRAKKNYMDKVQQEYINSKVKEKQLQQMRRLKDRQIDIFRRSQYEQREQLQKYKVQLSNDKDLLQYVPLSERSFDAAIL